jgi:hypothetical protein
MAVFDFIQVAPAGNGTAANTIYAATLGSTANSGVITTGFDMIIRVVCSQASTIRFGPSASLTAATATDIYLPANVPYIVDMGHQNNAISIYSTAANNIVTVNQVVKN